MSSISLRPTSLDFEETMTDLRAILATSPSWTGNLDNQTGTVLMNFVAAVNVFAQQRILRALQESFPDTAVSDRAHYSLASMQGVRIKRKSPASATASLVSSSALAIPAFTQFSSNGVYLFNRDALFLFPSVPLSVTLYEGIVKTTSISGLGVDYQMYVPFESGFAVSDSDVIVKIDGTAIQRSTIGIWDMEGIAGFEDRTLPDGRLSVVFGTSVYGTKPALDEIVEFTYVVTAGLAGNNAGLAGSAVYLDDGGSVSGTLTTALSGGSDQISAFQYKNIAPQTFGTFGSAVTKRQYHTLALQFPGIIDVVMFAQREIDPTDLAWMNLIKVCPLTAAGWGLGNEEALIEYLQEKTMYSTRFYIENPLAYPTDVSVRLYCYNWSNLSEVKQSVEDAVQTLFTPRAGYINYDIYKSDIGVAIRDSHAGIEYFELVTPTEDLIISSKPVSGVTTLVTAGIGTLPVATYFYGIGVNVNTSAGVSFIRPSSVVSVNVTAPASAVTLTWNPVPNAVSYVVYGRDGTGLYQIDLVAAGTTTMLDDGVLPQGAVAPTVNNHPVQYLTLNNLVVESKYSERQRN
jgi:hypothetical protein